MRMWEITIFGYGTKLKMLFEINPTSSFKYNCILENVQEESLSKNIFNMIWNYELLQYLEK